MTPTKALIVAAALSLVAPAAAMAQSSGATMPAPRG